MAQIPQIALDAQLRANLFGPRIVNLFLQSLQTGWIAAQFFRFCREIDKYSLTIRSVVVYVSAMAVFQTGGVMYAAWMDFVVFHDNPLSSLDLLWPDKIIPLEVMLMATPVQIVLVWRCYYILNRNRIVLAIFVALLMASSASAIHATYMFFQIQVPIPTHIEPADKVSVIRGVFPSYAVALILPAGEFSLGANNFDLKADFTLPRLFSNRHCYHFYSTLHGVHTRRIRRVIVRLITLAGQAAAPPCICAIVACILYMWLSFIHARSFWDIPFLAVLGKLYVSSLFVNLQSSSIFEIVRTRTQVTGNPTAITTQGGIDTTIYMEESSGLSRGDSQFTSSNETGEDIPLNVVSSQVIGPMYFKCGRSKPTMTRLSNAVV